MEIPTKQNPQVGLETKKGVDGLKMVFTCPMIILDEVTEFFKDNLESKFETPGDLMRQLVKMCDGKKTLQEVKNELTKEWDLYSLEVLLDELIKRKILVDSTRKILDSFEVVKNPQPYFNEIDKDGTAKLEAEAQIPKITGHQEVEIGTTPLIELISNRESNRRFSKESISQIALERMLWCAYGRLGKDISKRTVPSAGALYPMNISIVLLKKVGQYLPGVYRVTNNNKSSVGLVRISDKQNDIYGDYIDPLTLKNSTGVLLLSSDVSESSKKYGNRSFHYSVLEAGHIAQNFLLSASENNVGTVEVGGYYDNMIRETVGNNTSVTPLISIVFGAKDENPVVNSEPEQELIWFKPEAEGYRVSFTIAMSRVDENLMKEWSFGRHRDPEIAKIKAFAESREWASCSCVPDNLKRAKYSELLNAVNPLSIYSLDEAQYKSGKVNFRPFKSEDVRDWVKAERITDGTKHMILADFVYFPFNPGYDTYGYANTSGLAAHPERKIATQSAVLELIERDAFSNSYFSKLQHPTIKKSSLVKLQDRIKALEDKGFEVTFKDISLDLAPVVMVYVTNHQMGYTSCATCSKFNLEDAADHALMEVEGGVLSRLANGASKEILPNDVFTPQNHGALYEHPEHYNKAEFLIQGTDEINIDEAGKNTARNWDELVKNMYDKGMDIYIVDQQVSEKYGGNQGLNICRAFVPGIVPMAFGANIEPGGCERIYEIAKKFGGKDLTYEDLVKFPHPFA